MFRLTMFKQGTRKPKVGPPRRAYVEGLNSWCHFHFDGAADVRGLHAEYIFDNKDFTAFNIRADPSQRELRWGTGSPVPGGRITGDNVAAMGTIPDYSEKYTFYTSTYYGVRLRVNDQLIIDKPADQPV